MTSNSRHFEAFIPLLISEDGAVFVQIWRKCWGFVHIWSKSVLFLFKSKWRMVRWSFNALTTFSIVMLASLILFAYINVVRWKLRTHVCCGGRIVQHYLFWLFPPHQIHPYDTSHHHRLPYHATANKFSNLRIQ